MEWKKSDMPDLTGKIVVVTGAENGIGFETCRALAARNARVVMAVRSPEKNEENARIIINESSCNNVVVMKLDLSDIASIKRFADEYIHRFTRLDILINNADVIGLPLQRTAQGFEMHMGVNHFGHFVLTALLIDIINRTNNSRIVNVTSMYKLHKINFEDMNWDGSYSKMKAYGQSKVANILFTMELDRRLKEAARETTVVAVHPGVKSTISQKRDAESKGSVPGSFVQKLFGDKNSKVEPILFAATSAQATSSRIYGPDFPKEQVVNPELITYDDAERLWEISEKMTGENFYIPRERKFEPVTHNENNGHRF